MTNEKRPASRYAWYTLALVLAVAAIILLAVSYTHLTLPTKA